MKRDMPNKAAPVNVPIAALLQVEQHLRRVNEQRRWATSYRHGAVYCYNCCRGGDFSLPDIVGESSQCCSKSPSWILAGAHCLFVRFPGNHLGEQWLGVVYSTVLAGNWQCERRWTTPFAPNLRVHLRRPQYYSSRRSGSILPKTSERLSYDLALQNRSTQIAAPGSSSDRWSIESMASSPTPSSRVGR